MGKQIGDVQFNLIQIMKCVQQRVSENKIIKKRKKEDDIMAMEIINNYNAYENTYAAQKKAVSEKKTNTKTDKMDTSAAAKASASDYLAELQKKNPKLNILTGYSNGSAGSSNYPEKIDVTVAPGFLEKMASDPKLAAEYEKNLSDIPSACKWGENMIHAMTGDTVYEFRFYIDENGNMSAGSVSGPAQKRAEFERSRQRARHQKDEFNKRLESIREKSRERNEQLKEKVEEAKKTEDSQEQDSKVIVKPDNALDKAKNLLSEKLENADDGKIYLDNDDIQIIINAAKEEAQEQPDKVKNSVVAGNNFDMQI